MSKEAIRKCIKIAGGQVHLAEKMKAHLPPELAKSFRQGHIYKWLNAKTDRVPTDPYIAPMSAAVDHEVTPSELRPDLAEIFEKADQSKTSAASKKNTEAA